LKKQLQATAAAESTGGPRPIAFSFWDRSSFVFRPIMQIRCATILSEINKERRDTMKTTTIEKPAAKTAVFKRLSALALVFALIFFSIVLIRCIPAKESEYVDSVAGQIEQEMADNQIVLSKKGIRRTVADFKEPIILVHGKDSRLIVYTAELAETVSLANEGWGGFKWNSTYKEAKYKGLAEYTVDLSRLTEEDFIVNNEMKTLTVRIPYAVLSPINIPADQIKFRDIKKGWAAPKDIKLTTQENTQLTIQVNDKMKAKLIDDNIIAVANENAKIVVADLLAATVHAVDPEFTVVVVQ